MGPVGSAFATVLNYVTNEDQIKAIEGFVVSTPGLSEDNKRRIENGIAVARKNIEWDNARIDEVRTWVVKRYTDSATSVTISFAVIVASLLVFFVSQ